jgi:hypothetical protein
MREVAPFLWAWRFDSQPGQLSLGMPRGGRLCRLPTQTDTGVTRTLVEPAPVATSLRGCWTNASASGVLRGLRRVTWVVTGYDDDDAGVRPPTLRAARPLCPTYRVRSGGAVRGRAPWLHRRERFLTFNRLKRVVEGDAVAIGAAPPRSSRQEGQATRSFRRRTQLMAASPMARCSPRRRRLAYD